MFPDQKNSYTARGFEVLNILDAKNAEQNNEPQATTSLEIYVNFYSHFHFFSKPYF